MYVIRFVISYDYLFHLHVTLPRRTHRYIAKCHTEKCDKKSQIRTLIPFFQCSTVSHDSFSMMRFREDSEFARLSDSEELCKDTVIEGTITMTSSPYLYVIGWRTH